MAWEDRTPFGAIEVQFGLPEKEVIKLMRRSLKPSSFRLWRKRVTGRKAKHRELVKNIRNEKHITAYLNKLADLDEAN